MKKKIQLPLWSVLAISMLLGFFLLCSFNQNQHNDVKFSEWEKALMRDAYEIGYINAWTAVNDQIPSKVDPETKSWLRKAHREFGGTLVYNFIDKDPECKKLKF